MKITISSILTTLWLSLALNLSCTNRHKQVAPPPPVKERIKLKKVNVYLDASASNAGYYEGSTDFKNKVSSLLTQLNTNNEFLDSNKGVTIEVFWISDQDISSYGHGKDVVAKFLNESGTVNNAHQKSSTIDQYFDLVMRNTDSSTISILVSDCILSYPDSVIHINPDKNKQDADNGDLKNKTKISIAGEFGNEEKRPAFAVYAYLSPFNGTYYNYKNLPVKKQNLFDRPFYIWILTRDKDVLADFTNQVMSYKDLEPANQMSFGLIQDDRQTYTILPQLKRYGKWSPAGKLGLRKVVLDNRNTKLVFTLCVDLSGPSKKWTIEELNKYLVTSSKNNSCKFQARFLPKDSITQEDIKKHLSSGDKSVYNNTSHLLEVTVTEFLADEDTLMITMPFVYPEWYKQWSIHDDLDIESIENKTFAFDQIILAFLETMKDDKKKIININIPITK